MKRKILIAALSLAAVGCGTEVDLVPRTNGVGGSDEKLVLTVGVAGLVAATDGGDDTLEADEEVTVTSADVNVVSVLEAERVNEFVLVGQSVGSTLLHIDLNGSPNRDLPIEVIDDNP